MKRIKYIIFTFVVIFMGNIVVNAAPSYSFSVSPGSVENGKKVTASVTLKNVAAWNVRITSSGNTNGCTQAFADATANGGNTTKTLSVTCKATSLGAIGFTLSGDVTSSDGANISVSGNKRVTVVEPRPLSQNNYLASITVGEYELNPAFNEEVSEYSVTVPSTVNEINIDAKVKDRYASLTGTGTFEVVEGANSFKITVTAESGATREYTVNVIVEDINPIVITIDGVDYTIVKNIKNITAPELFQSSETIVNDTTVPAFVSDVSDFVLVAIRDSEGKDLFAIKNDDGTYTLYKTVTIGNLILYIMNKECPFEYFEKEKITIGDYEIDAYHSVNSSDYYLVYGINMATGNEGWYKYDTKESTLQRYENSTEIKLKDDLKQYFIVILVFGVGLIFAILIAILAVVMANKKLKKAKAIIQKNKVVEDKKEVKAPKEEIKQEKVKKEETKPKKEEKEDLEKTIKLEKNKNNKGSKKE